MTKLKQLMEELCPNGVEYRTLGEIAIDVFRGAGIKRDEVTEEGIPCVRYGEIYTTYGVWFDKCISHTLLENVPSPKYFEHGDILFAITGESVEDIAKSCAYIGHEKCLAGGDIVVLKHNQNPKYLAYALSTTDAQMQKSKGKVKSKVVHSSVPAIKEIVIPVPPLPVQTEIVRILDGFTGITKELAAEITSEIEASKQQYAYYRDALLNFDSDVPLVGLGDICRIRTGKLNANAMVENGAYPFFTCDANPYRIDTYAFDTDAVLISGNGSQVGHLHRYNGKFNAYQRTYVLDCFDSSISKDFLYHFLGCFLKPYILINCKKASVPYITLPMLQNFQIPIPTVKVQNKIVRILDSFTELTVVYTATLTTENMARQKQYEYYRDKLLTFKERVD